MLRPAKPLLAPWLMACALATGCASSSKRLDPPLPFHVALVPVSVEEVGPGDAGDDALRIRLDAAVISARIARELAETQFARATLLEFPADVPREEFLARDIRHQDEHWISQAASAGADLIIVSEVDYAGAVRSAANDRVWYNVPLFLLGGPFCWFVPDRDYEFEAGIEANVHDLSTIGALKNASLRDDAANLTGSIQRDYGQTSLNFTRRAGGNVGYYLLSVVWPASFLARDTGAVERRLEERITEHLCDDLALEIRNRSNLLVSAGKICPFEIEQLALEPNGDGARLTGKIHLDLSKQDSMGWYRVECDGERWVQASFSEGKRLPPRPGRTTTALYELDVELPASFEGVRVVLTDGSEESTRSFSLSSRTMEAVYKR